jgi:hypothetical protein
VRLRPHATRRDSEGLARQKAVSVYRFFSKIRSNDGVLYVCAANIAEVDDA